MLSVVSKRDYIRIGKEIVKGAKKKISGRIESDGFSTKRAVPKRWIAGTICQFF